MIWTVIKDTPSRIKDAFLDPIRRRQVGARILETFLPAVIVFYWDSTLLSLAWKIPAVVIGEFLLYEWVLEPIGWAGHYWERGPRDGETFRD